MSTLCTVRRLGGAVGAGGWIASIAVAAYAALAPTRVLAQRALAGEMILLAVALAATLASVLAHLAIHIDETQWAVTRTEAIILQASQLQGQDANSDVDAIAPARRR